MSVLDALAVLRSSFKELEDIALELIEIGEGDDNACVRDYHAYKRGYDLLVEEIGASAVAIGA